MKLYPYEVDVSNCSGRSICNFMLNNFNYIEDYNFCPFEIFDSKTKDNLTFSLTAKVVFYFKNEEDLTMMKLAFKNIIVKRL